LHNVGSYHVTGLLTHHHVLASVFLCVVVSLAGHSISLSDSLNSTAQCIMCVTRELHRLAATHT